MNKKTLLIIAVIVLALAGIGGGIYLVNQNQEVREKAAPATTIFFQPETKETKINDVVNFDILVNTGENSLASVRLDISFDQNILQPVSLSFSSLLPVPLRPVDISQPGKMTGSAGVAVGTSILGSGQKIASCSFRVLSAAPSETTISFGANTLASSATTVDEGTNLIIRKNPATLIATAPANPPTSSPTNTLVIEPTSLPTTVPTSPPAATPALGSVGVGEEEPTVPPTSKPAVPTTKKATTTPVPTIKLPKTGGILPTIGVTLGGIILGIIALLLAF